MVRITGKMRKWKKKIKIRAVTIISLCQLQDEYSRWMCHGGSQSHCLSPDQSGQITIDDPLIRLIR